MTLSYFKQTKTALSLASSDEVKEALLSSRFASEVCIVTTHCAALEHLFV